LQNSIEMLKGGAKDLAGHQQTLKDTIEWSYKLLTPNEQSVFRRLSVFTAGCTLESAVSLGSDGHADHDISSDVMSLVRKNLVTQAFVDGQIRVGMLETIRQFGVAQLERSPEEASMRRNHAEHYLALAERSAPGLTGRQQRLFVTSLMTEQDNLRAALAWTIQERDLGMTSRFLTALLWLWIPRGQFTEGRTWAKRALDAFAGFEHTREFALILEAAGWLEVLSGDYPAGMPLFERAYNIFTNLPDVRERARACVTLGVACLVLGDERGRALSDEALQLALTQQDKTVLALARLSVGIRHQVSGEGPEAAASYREALDTFYEADNVFWPGQALQNLARLHLELDDYASAMALASEALEIGREYGYPMIRNLSLAVIGSVAVKKRDLLLAARLFGAVQSSLSELGVSFEPPEQGAMDEDIKLVNTLLDVDAYAAAFGEGSRWGEPDILTAVRSFHAGCLVGNAGQAAAS
jgi:non-specific serine/threonine protein kinase